MYRYNSSSNNYPIDQEITYYKERLAKLNPEKASDTSTYIDIKTNLDMLELTKQYGQSSWQANVISEQLVSYIQEMNTYQYGTEKNEEVFQKVQEKYNQLVEKLNSDDWRYFAKSNLEEVNQKIADQKNRKESTIDKKEIASIENEIQDLETEKQVLIWRLDKNISYENSALNSALNKYYESTRGIRSYEQSDSQDYEEKQSYYKNLEKASKSRYAIENGVDINNDTNARGILLDVFSQYEIFIIIVVVMIAGAIVSEEFSKGTIKLLLVRPYKRNKILLAKFITCILMILIMILGIIAVQFVVGGVVHGFDSLKIPAVIYDHVSNQLQTMNIAQYLTLMAISKLPLYILIATIVFAFSTIFTNTALAVVMGFLAYMSTQFINAIGQLYHITILKFFITPNWDLSQYLFGNLPSFQYTNFSLSCIMCIVYLLVILIPTFIIFKKKNIKNI